MRPASPFTREGLESLRQESERLIKSSNKEKGKGCPGKSQQCKHSQNHNPTEERTTQPSRHAACPLPPDDLVPLYHLCQRSTDSPAISRLPELRSPFHLPSHTLLLFSVHHSPHPYLTRSFPQPSPPILPIPFHSLILTLTPTASPSPFPLATPRPSALSPSFPSPRLVRNQVREIIRANISNLKADQIITPERPPPYKYNLPARLTRPPINPIPPCP